MQAEESLKELDAGINELKKSVDKLQIDQPSAQELSKLQVRFISFTLELYVYMKGISIFSFCCSERI